MKESIKVLIVEDDDDFAYLLQKELGRQERIVLVGICREKEEAITQTEALRPDIVLMDLHLGSSYSDGIEASRRIRIATEAKVLILTALGADEIIREAAGRSFASGYIFKDQMPLLIENIYAAADRVTGQERILAQASLSCLSAAEKTVFYMMLGREERLRSSKKTIANQKTQILKKLGLDNVNELRHVFRCYIGE